MYRHIYIKKILSIKYYEQVPIDIFKRFTLPANDNLMRQGDLYKLTYMSIKEQGLLDPVLCYDVVNVDLNNPPIYKKKRKIFGAYLLRGNIRWLCCKDLGITHVNAVVAKMDHGQREGNLFLGTNFTYSTVRELHTNEDINDCYSNYNPKTIIHKNWIEMHVPSLASVDKFGVKDSEKIISRYNDIGIIPAIDYVKQQLIKEK